VFGAQMQVVDWIGEIFLDILKMLVVPLIVSSMIVGIAGLGDIRKVGKTGLITLIYFGSTTLVSVILGLAVVNLMKPGAGIEMAVGELPEHLRDGEAIGLVDILKTFVSPNLVQAMAEMDILPLILFSLLFGGVLTTLGEVGKPVIRFFDGVNAAIMKIVHLVMYFAPIGVFGLIAARLGAAGGGELFLAELLKIGKFALTVLLGLLLHALVVLPLVLTLITRRNPLVYLKNVTQALTTAFSTASSSATLPVTVECAEVRNKVSRKASLFVLPIGATVNMDGTALYESVAALFIAQMVGIDLGLGQQMIVFLTATLAAVGAAGIPEAGLVTMVMVLHAVGLPLEGIGMILSIDWFLDRCRTAVNVWGDSIGAAVVDTLEEKFVEGGVQR
ncbi:MAG: cation:dicarboxylase symporter family transporter, partial [Nitrospinaceae bacterium]|nr:dicarboxylate/amino acid:cation symporter [Nitrospinaceae bacterium]NIR54205.1 dicarboxylate/amino acid:cation symporter [Nitrospinaceae bacterium]NIS84620.1 dicarboxylate/amino acid:cation symporter [Nitrospinaceae bacterium]NIT81415.1 dicarboxylate/amino acid:cation symporter [Nitrospinaceae bacterium]NIU43699.1 dicarboxylate/amino acid:cation symporter [Nitrospinaceae bacterium]